MLLYVYYFKLKKPDDLGRTEVTIYAPDEKTALKRCKKWFGHEGELLRRENW